MEITELLSNIMQSTPSFVMLIGCPASGKSTLADTIDGLVDNVSIVCPDDIREKLCGDRYDQTKNGIVFTEVYNLIEEDLEDGKHVIYDATNTQPKFREKILRIVNRYDCTIIGVVIKSSIVKCIERNNEREHPVPINVIERMYLNLMTKPITLDEGFDWLIEYNVD